MEEGTQVYSQGRQRCVKVFTDGTRVIGLVQARKGALAIYQAKPQPIEDGI